MGFALDEVGPKETLVVGKKALFGSSHREHRLLAHVTTAGRTRVIIFRYILYDCINLCNMYSSCS